MPVQKSSKDRKGPRVKKIPPEILRSWASYYKYRPVEFADRVLPWGVPGTPYETWKGLWRWQRELLQGVADEMRAKRWGYSS